MRITAAALVIISHSFPILGYPEEPVYAHTQYLTLGGFSVGVFFSISGYLLCKSWFNSSSITDYLKKRALRIFPALIVIVLLTAFILGPLISGSTAGEYFTHKDTWRYLGNITLVVQAFVLPGVFSENPIIAVNGSLWTLRYEFLCYLMLPIAIILAGKLNKAPVIAIISGATLFLAVDAAYFFDIRSTLILPDMKMHEAFRFIFFFFAGAYLALNKSLVTRLGAVSAILIIIALAVNIKTLTYLVLTPLIPITVIWLGEKSTPLLRQAGKYGDFSYGLYLYGMPVQQTLFFFGLNDSFFYFSFYSVLIASFFGLVSWHLIEKQAMKFK